MELLKKNNTASQELLELLYSAADPLPLACFRIAFGIVLLGVFLTLCLQFDPLFTPNSPVSLEVSTQFADGHSGEMPFVQWSLFHVSASKAWAAALFAIYGASLLAFLLGWQTRLATLVAFVCTVSIHRREPFIWTGGDLLAQLMLFWLMFLPAGAALSLDALRRRSRGTPQPVVRSWNMGLLQAQLSLVYLSTFLLKMGSASWQQGQGLAHAWQITYHARPWGEFLNTVPGLAQLGTWATLAFELVFASFIWSRRMRPWLLGVGVLFHIAIELTLRAGPFTYVMLACYIPFLSAEYLLGWARQFTPVRMKWENAVWQGEMLRQGRWVVYYDGSCGFCRRWVARARRLAWRRVEWRDFQAHGTEAAYLQPRFDQAAYLIIGGRKAYPGFQAFRKLLFAMPLLWPPLLLLYLPGSRSVGDRLYRLISQRYGPVSAAPACRANAP